MLSDNPGAWSNITTNYEIVDRGVGTTHSCFVTTSPSGEVTAQVRVCNARGLLVKNAQIELLSS